LAKNEFNEFLKCVYYTILCLLFNASKSTLGI